METIVLVTGGFDPLHSGHLAYLKAARKLGDKLIVGVNSDSWLERKKGKNFLPLSERYEIVSSIKYVDNCILFNDNDDTAIEAIKNVIMLFPFDRIIFANGGDRKQSNVPEQAPGLFDREIIFQYGVGGADKKNSSSWILKKWDNL
jgi:cytidyltransferase-like protein